MKKPKGKNGTLSVKKYGKRIHYADRKAVKVDAPAALKQEADRFEQALATDQMKLSLFFSDIIWTPEKTDALRSYILPTLVSGAWDIRRFEQYVAYLDNTYNTAPEAVLTAWPDYLKEAVVTDLVKSINYAFKIGDHEFVLPFEKQAVYADYMRDAWINDPALPQKPIFIWAMQKFPAWTGELVEKLIEKVSIPPQYDIITVLKKWGLLNDFRLGNAIRLIAKTDKSELEIDLQEAIINLGDLLDDYRQEMANAAG